MIQRKKILLLQYSAAISGCLTAVGMASMLSWRSPAVPYLTRKNSEISFSQDDSFWIVPLFNIGCIIGFILNPLIIDNLSRKRTLLIYSIPDIISWILIILAKNHVTIYLGLLLGGIGFGAGYCGITVYLSEIGNQKNRGIFFVILKLSLSIGYFFTMFLGAFVSYNSMNIILLIVPLIFLGTFSFMPDSTYFQEENNKKSEEEVKLKAENEMKMISLKIPEEEKETEIIEPNESKLRSKSNFIDMKLWNLFALVNNRRALIIILLCVVQNLFSGSIIIKSFAQQIFTYEGSIMQPEKAAFIMTAVSIISSILSIFIVENFKRRTLLLIFGILASLSHGIVGLFFFLKYCDFDVSALNLVPLIGINVYDFSITTGTINILLIYQGELFTNDVKSMAITFLKVLLMVLNILVTIWFQLLIEVFNMFAIFWIFATICGILTIVIFYLAPETKGKSLEEIQILLKSRRIII